MGDFWLQVVAKDPRDRDMLDRTFRAKWMATDTIGLEALIRREPERVQLRNDIAVLYMELDRPAEAATHFAEALKQKPDAPAAHFNYGTALAASGRLEEAVAEYKRALQLRPEYAIAHNNLGSALLRLGRPDEALAAFREAARVDPRLGEAHLNAGLLSGAAGDFAEAVARFRRALQLSPDWITALSSLASVLAAAPDATVRNPAEAVKLAERVVALTARRDASLLDVLAVAHAAAGDFDRALAVVDEALALSPPTVLATLLGQHRTLFSQRQPYVSTR